MNDVLRRVAQFVAGITGLIVVVLAAPLLDDAFFGSSPHSVSVPRVVLAAAAALFIAALVTAVMTVHYRRAWKREDLHDAIERSGNA